MFAPKLRRWLFWGRRTPFHPQWLLGAPHAAAPIVREVARGIVVDIGCADRWVSHCLPSGCSYIGLDYVSTGRDMYGARPDVFGDASSLPFRDQSVDTVVILDVVEHLERPREAWAEIARVLRPNGRLVLSVPFLYPIHDSPHDYQRYTSFGLTRELAAVQMRVVSLKPTLGAAETAGLMACLAISGIALQAATERRMGIVLVPLLVACIPLINVFAWALGRLLPSWASITAGYQLVATKQ